MSTLHAASGPRLFTRENLPLTVGAVALVTLGAFENRAVTTSLPTAMRDLGGLTSYGLVVAAPLATYLIALTTSGWMADRQGPARVLRVGAALFVVGQVLVGLANAVPMFVIGRLFGGLAEGFLDVGLMVLIARVMDSSLRPRVMAMFSAAWILPSVLGPVVAGTITDVLGWRWVFGIGLVLLAVIWPLLQPAIRRSRTGRQADDTSYDGLLRLLPWAGGAAAALLALNIATESLRPHGGLGFLPAVTIIGGILTLAIAAARLLPSGSWRAACGIGGVVAVNAAVATAYVGVGAFLPLLLTTQRGYSATGAGVSLMITGLFWSAGSAIQTRLTDHPVGLVRTGLFLVSTGAAGSLLLLRSDLPAWIGLTAWAIAATGMGLSSSTLDVLTMSASDDSTQGRNNSGAQMAASMAMAVFLAVAGGVLAMRGVDPTSFVMTTLIAVGIGLGGLLLTGRVRCAAP